MAEEQEKNNNNKMCHEAMQELKHNSFFKKILNLNHCIPFR